MPLQSWMSRTAFSARLALALTIVTTLPCWVATQPAATAEDETGFAVFVAAGFAAQWIFWRFSSGIRDWIAAARMETISGRLTVMAARLAYSATPPLAFAIGGIGAFLAFASQVRATHATLRPQRLSHPDADHVAVAGNRLGAGQPPRLPRQPSRQRVDQDFVRH